MKKAISYLFYISSMLILTACHTFNQEKQYLQEQSIQSITVPSALSSSAIENHYPIPPIPVESQVGTVDITPPKIITTND